MSSIQQSVAKLEQNHYVKQELEAQYTRHQVSCLAAANRVYNRVEALREGGKDNERALTLALEDFSAELFILKSLVKGRNNVVAPPTVRQKFFRWFSRTFLGLTDV